MDTTPISETTAPLGKKRRLGKYRVVKRLAQGGFATVYEAADTVEGVHVALKVPRADWMTPSAMRLFRKEVRLHAGLDHPAILQLKTADVIDGRLVIAYPLGVESLGERIRRRMGVETFTTLAEQMLEAVAHAHANGVIHCDLKPDNFILFDNQRIRLTDFSISRLARRTVLGSGSGTVGYVAPEQAMGRTSFRADVFSLGLIFYQMLSGELPEWPFRWPPPGHDRVRRKVPEEFVQLLRRALSVEPARRFRDGGEMLAAYRRVLPRVRRFIAGRRRRRTNHAAQVADWREVRFRQFRRELGAALQAHHHCRKCEGPVAEPMSHCPWCAATLSFTRGSTKMPAECPRCRRGRKLDWRFCAWCHGAGFEEVAGRHYSDKRYTGRCAHAACRGPLMPFSRYCPWCRRKVRKPVRPEVDAERCRRCGWSVFPRYWEHCPWCAHALHKP